jgi:hypothetical protein
MSARSRWAELASQNERLALPSDQPSETTGGTVSSAERAPRGPSRNEPSARSDLAGPDASLARSA